MNATRPLTAVQRTSLESALRTRQRELRADVAAKLKTQDDPRLVGLRNRMEDTDDWAAADAMAAHKATRHYQTWRDAVAPMMAAPRTSVRYAGLFPAEPRWETPGAER